MVPAPKARLYRKVLVEKCPPGCAEGPCQGQPRFPRKCFKNVLGTRLEGTFECKARLENADSGESFARDWRKMLRFLGDFFADFRPSISRENVIGQERKRHININLFGRWPLRWPGGLSTGRPWGSKIYVLSSEPKVHKSFCPGTRPGGPVTELTGQSFMWQSFMCLFLKSATKMTGRPGHWSEPGEYQFWLFSPKTHPYLGIEHSHKRAPWQ